MLGRAGPSTPNIRLGRFYLNLIKISQNEGNYAHFDDVTFFPESQNFFSVPGKKVRRQKKVPLTLPLYEILRGRVG